MNVSYTLPNAQHLIDQGIKIHTMRDDPNDKWQPGKLMHHCTGMRSKQYNCFLLNECKSTQRVLLILDNKMDLRASVDRRRLSKKEVETLAINDGFESVGDMAKWFMKKGRTMWAGKLLHWTDFKY
jgi:hypothetical protein